MLVLLALSILIGLDMFVQQARRANAAIYFLCIIFFYCASLDRKRYRLMKWSVPMFFFVGTIFSSNIGQYRINAYAQKTDAWDNIEQALTTDSKRSKRESIWSVSEVRNAISGINFCYATGDYDLGATNWNGVVGPIVPKALVGAKVKESLMIDASYSALRDKLTKSGSTMTGYFDAFGSFGLLGFIKFLIIGYIMGALWRRMEVSYISLFLYLALLTPALHIVSHSSNNFVAALVLYAILVYPFLTWCIGRKRKKAVRYPMV